MGSHHPLNHATSPLPVTPSFPSYKKREGRKCTIINFYQEPGAISPGQVLCDTFPRRSALRPSIIVLLRRSHGHVSALRRVRPYPFLTTATRPGADLDKTARRAASARCDYVLLGTYRMRCGRRCARTSRTMRSRPRSGSGTRSRTRACRCSHTYMGGT